MPTKAGTGRLVDGLRSLAECQLQMQTVRSAALDGGALGVMAVDAGVAAIVIGSRGGYDLWILALVLLGLSLSLAVHTLRLPGAEQTGPVVEEIQEAHRSNDEHQLEESLLEDLAKDIRTNRQTLARKAPLFDQALTSLVLAITIELAGRLL
jgi:hypothetical protein